MSIFSNLFKSLDFVSSEVKLNYKGKSKFKSHIGAVITILIVILTLIISIILTISVFQFQNPKVSISNVNRNTSFLNFSEFSPIMIGFSDSNGYPLINQSQYFSVNIYSNVVEDINKTRILIKKNLISKPCDQNIITNEFGKNSEFFLSAVPSPFLSFATCVPTLNNPGFYIKNPFATTNSSSITVSLTLCNNSTSLVPCQPQELINSIIGNYFVFIIIGDYTFDHSNENAGEFKIFNKPYPISANFLKLLSFSYRPVSYITDYTMVTNNKVTKSFSQINKVATDNNDKGSGHYDKSTFFEALITFDDNIENVYTRSYQTLAQLLGEISGIFNFLWIISILLNSYFEEKLKQQEIFDICCNSSFIERSGSNNKKKHHRIEILSRESSQAKPILESQVEMDKTIKKNEKKENPNLVKNFTYSSDKTGLKKIGTTNNNYVCVLFEFGELAQNILNDKNNENHYRNLIPFGRSKAINLKMVLSDLLYNQIFDVVFIFNNLLDFQILKRKLDL